MKEYKTQEISNVRERVGGWGWGGVEERYVARKLSQQKALTSEFASHNAALLRKPTRLHSTSSSHVWRPMECCRMVTLSKVRYPKSFMFLFLPISHSPIPSFHILYSNSLQSASSNEEWGMIMTSKTKRPILNHKTGAGQWCSCVVYDEHIFLRK